MYFYSSCRPGSVTSCLLLTGLVFQLVVVIHGNCFNDYNPNSLGNIDPDINYYKAINTLNSTPYYDDQTFGEKNGKNIKLSMFHLNIRNIPDRFRELTTLLSNLDTNFKISAISETWIKPHHISYNIPNYKLEQNFGLKKRDGGVALSTTK